MSQLYLDCDGVLADFDKAGEKLWGMPPRDYEAKVGTQQFWKELQQTGDFYEALEKMPYADQLIASTRSYNPIILTGAPRGDWAQEQKLRWRDKHFPRIPMVVCQASDKSKWCKPGDVLVDDREKYKLKWECAGGFWITYSTKNHLECLSKIDYLMDGFKGGVYV